MGIFQLLTLHLFVVQVDGACQLRGLHLRVQDKGVFQLLEVHLLVQVKGVVQMLHLFLIAELERVFQPFAMAETAFQLLLLEETPLEVGSLPHLLGPVLRARWSLRFRWPLRQGSSSSRIEMAI